MIWPKALDLDMKQTNVTEICIYFSLGVGLSYLYIKQFFFQLL